MVNVHVDEVIGDCALYREGVRQPGPLPLAVAGDAARTSAGFVWIGLQQPRAEDVEAVAKEFDLPPLAVEDAVKAHQRPKLEVYGDVLFAVLKPVRYVDHDEVVDVTEIAVFVGPTFVVTVRHGQSDVLGQVRRELDSGQALHAAAGPAAVLYRAADLIVDGYEQVIAYIDDDVAEIEGQVFSPATGDHAERIYKLKREVLEFRRAVQPLAIPLQRLAAGGVFGIPEVLVPYFRDVHDHLLRAADAIDSHDRLLTDVLQANLARVSVRQSAEAVRQNEDLRKISAWAAIALVPTAIAGIYGMNFENLPELEWEYGYFMVLGLIATVCVSLYVMFRRNDWL
ncbi:MAG TPA: magnesium and cobalt transport protein CorA [Mycobacteriales bacterium]|nr:magnesium and cobalt transport protein CorA [Mycobacteriales bacterium]